MDWSKTCPQCRSVYSLTGYRIPQWYKETLLEEGCYNPEKHRWNVCSDEESASSVINESGECMRMLDQLMLFYATLNPQCYIILSADVCTDASMAILQLVTLPAKLWYCIRVLQLHTEFYMYGCAYNVLFVSYNCCKCLYILSQLSQLYIAGCIYIRCMEHAQLILGSIQLQLKLYWRTISTSEVFNILICLQFTIIILLC